jgi:hypothetical protein
VLQKRGSKSTNFFTCQLFQSPFAFQQPSDLLFRTEEYESPVVLRIVGTDFSVLCQNV